MRKDLTYPNVIDMLSYTDNEADFGNQGTKYQLIGLAEHVGMSEQSGHYTAHA